VRIKDILKFKQLMRVLGYDKKIKQALFRGDGGSSGDVIETDPIWTVEKTGYLKLDQTTPQAIINGVPANLSEPTFTYTAGLLTKISYPSGYEKNFTYNVDETLDEIDYNGEHTKKFNYTGGVLTSIST
jgi:hypothetical protein